MLLRVNTYVPTTDDEPEPKIPCRISVFVSGVAIDSTVCQEDSFLTNDSDNWELPLRIGGEEGEKLVHPNLRNGKPADDSKRTLPRSSSTDKKGAWWLPTKVTL
jgi:hypothetical protein